MPAPPLLIPDYLHASSPHPPESSTTQKLITALHLNSHIEGGYFVETDRDPLRIPNPFLTSVPTKPATTQPTATRAASTSILYFLTPAKPQGAFHRNRGRTVHTLHWGRGRYVIIHAGEVVEKERIEKVRIETFVVGKNVLAGEKVQWIVDGGKFKASFLLDEEGEGEEGLLISETVVPGFEYEDHAFLLEEQLRDLVTPAQAEELKGLLRDV